MNLEEAIANDLAQQMADSLDAAFLIELKYADYKKLYGPGNWVYGDIELKAWVGETLPDCFYHNKTLYYKDEADATLFRLKWL